MSARSALCLPLALALVAMLASCAGPEMVRDKLVYEESFADITTNAWLNTDDPLQFPGGATGYSFTWETGRYKVTNTGTTLLTAPVPDGAKALGIASPYRLSADISFPPQGVISISITIFNYVKEGGTGNVNYDYVALTSDARYLSGHYSSDSGGYSYYTSGWVGCGVIRIDGSSNTLVVDQSGGGFVVSLNGKRLGYYHCDYAQDGDVGFCVGALRDGSDMSIAGSASVLYDNIRLYI